MSKSIASLQVCVGTRGLGPSFLRRKRSRTVIFEPAACSLHCDVDFPADGASLERYGSERRRRNGEGEEVSGAESGRVRVCVSTRRSRTASGRREKLLRRFRSCRQPSRQSRTRTHRLFFQGPSAPHCKSLVWLYLQVHFRINFFKIQIENGFFNFRPKF